MRAALVFTAALAAIAPGAPRGEEIYTTKHNFYGAEKRAPATPEESNDLCQMCHVPNRLRNVAAPPPRWGGEAQGGQNAALDVRADPAGPPLSLRWAGSTLRCLSCHDGTISSINITFRPASTSLSSDPVASDRHRRDAQRTHPAASSVFWLATTMGNHPVAIPYPLELEQAQYRQYEPRAVPLRLDWDPDPRTHGLKLFSDTSGFGAAPGSAGIECASCHDPHGTKNPFFLRLPKARSELCLACHRK